VKLWLTSLSSFKREKENYQQLHTSNGQTKGKTCHQLFFPVQMSEHFQNQFDEEERMHMCWFFFFAERKKQYKGQGTYFKQPNFE